MKTVTLGGITYRTARSFKNKELKISNSKGFVLSNGMEVQYTYFYFVVKGFYVCRTWQKAKEGINIIVHPSNITLKELRKMFIGCRRELGKPYAAINFAINFPYAQFHGFSDRFYLGMTTEPIRPKAYFDQKSFVFPPDFLLELKSKTGRRYYSMLKLFKNQPIYLLLLVDSNGKMRAVEPYPVPVKKEKK